jgi:hypothetical protein
MKPLSTTVLSPDSEYTNVYVTGPFGMGEHNRFHTSTFVILKKATVAELKKDIVARINKRKGSIHEYVLPTNATITHEGKTLSNDMLMEKYAYNNLYIVGWEDSKLS